jgi:hypothetical protein
MTQALSKEELINFYTGYSKEDLIIMVVANLETNRELSRRLKKFPISLLDRLLNKPIY